MVFSAGSCAEYSCCVPPTSTVMSPAAARCTPPVTGQTKVETPTPAARAAIRSTSTKSLVLISIQVLPGCRKGIASFITAALAAGEGQDGMRADHDLASSDTPPHPPRPPPPT